LVVVGTAAKREEYGKDAERKERTYSNSIVAHHLRLRRIVNDEVIAI
jgi:hypothetical protein